MPPRDLTSTDLPRGGLTSIARSARTAISERFRRLALARQPVPLETQFEWYTRLWGIHNRLRYDVPTDPWATIEVDPTAVMEYVPDVELPWGLGRVRGGDWSQPANRLPLADLPRYRGLVQRFEKGHDWTETDYYDHLVARYADHDGPFPRGHEEFDAFWRDRREAHEALYRSMRDDGYRPNSAVEHDPDDWGEYVHSLEPLVVVGHDGELLWSEGFGRLCVAKLLGIESMPVYVLCRHERWQRVRERLYGTERGSCSQALERHRDHPDVPTSVG